MSSPAGRRAVAPAHGAVHAAAVPQHAVLQRKCACGKGAGRGHDECDDCQGKAKLQPKLRIGAASDAFEQEADRAADRVMGMRSSVDGPSSLGPVAPLVQRRTTDAPSSLTAAPAIVDTVLQSGGTPLDRASRDFFEPRFGHDFSRVRVHSGPTAAQSADAVDAAAYTVGSHIVLGGSFVPGSSASRSLMAHELVHTIQQGGPSAAPVLARKRKSAVKQEMEVLEAPKSADPSNAPWLVYREATEKQDRKALMPSGTRVEASGGPIPDTWTGTDGKPRRMMFRRVKVLALPAKAGDPDRILNKNGVVQDKFLAAVPPKDAPKKAAPKAATRYSAAALDARRKQALTPYANALAAQEAEARERYIKAQQGQVMGSIEVDPNVLGGYGGPAQLAAQALGEPIKEEILVAHAKLAELAEAIEGNPLFQFFNGLISGVRENLDLKVFADNADTFAKFSALWHFSPTLQGNFFLGAATGIKKEIESLIGLVKNFSEVKDEIIELAKVLMSDQGANAAYQLGYGSGAEFGRRMTAVGGIKEVDKLATALGEAFGPILVEALIVLFTAGAGAAVTRASSALKTILTSLMKAKKAIPGKGLPDLPKPKPNLPNAPGAPKPDAPSPSAGNKAKGQGSGADGGSKTDTPDKTPSAGKRLPDAQAKELKALSKVPNNVKAVTDEALLKEGYKFEVVGKDHTYRRHRDGTWCRFSTKECGFEEDEEQRAESLKYAKRELNIATGWAVEDHLLKFNYSKGESNFKGIDGWKNGESGGHGIVRHADVIQIKAISEINQANVISRFDEGVKGLLESSWQGQNVRLITPSSRNLHLVFNDLPFANLGFRQEEALRALLKRLSGLQQKPPIKVRWFYYAHGTRFEITK